MVMQVLRQRGFVVPYHQVELQPLLEDETQGLGREARCLAVRVVVLRVLRRLQGVEARPSHPRPVDAGIGRRLVAH